MTLQTTNNTTSSTQTLGGNLVFLFDYRMDLLSDAVVTVDGVNETGFSVTGLGDSAGGSVTLLTAPVLNAVVVVARIVPETQNVSYPVRGAFPAPSHEGAMDRIVMMVQQIIERTTRSLRFPLGDTASTLLTDVKGRKNKFLAFDTSGDLAFTDATSGDELLRADLANPSQGDALVAGKRPEAGSTSFTLDGYHRTRTINVITDFGAVGDGVIDDTLAIQAAIDSLVNGISRQTITSRGGAIFFPKGIYNISSAILVRTDDYQVRIFGDSNGSSVINVIHDGIGVDVAGSSSSFTDQFVIEDLHIIGDPSVPRIANSMLIRIRYMNMFHVNRCWLSGTTETGIRVEDCLDGDITYCRIDQPPAVSEGFRYGVHGISVSVFPGLASNDINVYRCRFEDTVEAALFIQGRASQSSDLWSVHGCLFQSNENYGVHADGVDSLEIIRCWFEGNGQNTISGDDVFIEGTVIDNRQVNIISNRFNGSSTGWASFNEINIDNAQTANIQRNNFGVTPMLDIDTGVLSLSVKDNQSLTQPVIVNKPFRSIWENNNTASSRWTGVSDDGPIFLQVIPYAASITPDAALGRYISVGLLTGDITINGALNVRNNQEFTIIVQQDASGLRAITWDSSYRFVTAIDTTASLYTSWTFKLDTNTGKFTEVSSSAGMV